MFAGNGQSKVTEQNLDTEKIEALKEYLGGGPNSDFFVMAITRNSKEPLSPFEIHFLKVLLSQLLNKPTPPLQCVAALEENINKTLLIAEANGVKSYLETLKDPEIHRKEDMNDSLSILDACNSLNTKSSVRYQAYDYQSTINIQRTNNECTQLSFSITKNDEFSIKALRNATGIIAFNEYFFGNIPFPHSAARNYSISFSQINEHYLFACNFLTYTKEFQEEQVSESIAFFNKNTLGENPISVSKLTPETLTKEKNGKFMMENKTFYPHKNGIVSTYNKSSYFKENDEFLANEQAFYYFGDKTDHPAADQIAVNISTEICRDVSLALRREDTSVVNLHLIQSNSLNNLIQYTGYLPPAWCYIFCDPSVANRDICERNRDGRSHVYFGQAVKRNSYPPCYSCSFDLHNCRYDINIYKIN